MISSVSNSNISQLFSKLDTKSQGYLEVSDLVSAFSEINASGNSTDATELFSALDSDSDGKVTESEFSTTLSKLQEELDSQFNQMRMQGGQGMPPPPPPQEDAGFTEEELTQQLSEIGSSDANRANFISNVLSDFSAADTNGDGKVSFAEAQAVNQNSDTSSTQDTSAIAASSSTGSSDAQLMQQIMRLMHAYGALDSTDNTTATSLLSISA